MAVGLAGSISGPRLTGTVAVGALDFELTLANGVLEIEQALVLQASDSKEAEPKAKRRRRERETEALVLTGHGLSIRVDQGCLLVRDGNTHFPAERPEWRFFNGALDVPPSIVVIDGSGEITLDAIDWLATQKVPLIRLKWDGLFASIVTTGGQAASSDKVYWQERTRNDPTARLRFARDLIRDKALSTLATMEDHVPRSSVWNNSYENIAARSRLL